MRPAERRVVGNIMPGLKILPFNYSLPIIWADTNFVIGMTKGRLGDEKYSREKNIYEKIYMLTREGKAIYLKASQRGEYGLNNHYLKEIDETHEMLSYGVYAQHESITRQFQIQKAMSLYHDKKTEMCLSSNEIFSEDPIHAREKAKKLGVIISVRSNDSAESMASGLKSRDEITNNWEKVRKECVKNSISYIQQLENEYRANYDVLIKRLETYVKKYQEGALDFEDQIEMMGQPDYFDWWRLVTGQRADFKGLKDFMYSETYKSIPSVEILTMLLASLMTQPNQVEKGDWKDAENISIILPYASIILTDRSLKHRLYRLGITDKYSKDVYALEDSDQIIERLQQLSH